VGGPPASPEGLEVPFPDGLALLRTATRGLGQEEALLARMRELALQATDGTLTSGARAVLDTEFQSLIGEVDRIAHQTRHSLAVYEQIPLLNGTRDIYLEGSPPLGILLFHDLPDASASGLGLPGLSGVSFDITSVPQASMALVPIDAALERIVEYQIEQDVARHELTSGS
jgi:flagellin